MIKKKFVKNCEKNLINSIQHLTTVINCDILFIEQEVKICSS